MKYILPLLVGVLLFAIGCSAPQQSQAKYRSVIEITATDSIVSPDRLLSICSKHAIAPDSVYQWRNHLVVYGLFDNSVVDKLQSELQAAYTDATVHGYEAPFYIFDRGTECETDGDAKESAWTHILMTANLVEPPAKQQEYLDLHAHQREQWPEVAAGFCHADFRQVLVFRNGRQLMLVISIPKGEDLDELNPRTTENNPRVDDWNALMSQYQEGIPGTQPGETWVVLQPITIQTDNI